MALNKAIVRVIVTYVIALETYEVTIETKLRSTQNIRKFDPN